MKVEILVLFTIVLLGFTVVSTESFGIKVKKYKVIDSPEVCGDKLCKELEGENVISPLKQFKQGVPIEKIRCKEGFELVLKNSNNHPACIKSSSVDILVQRGWGIVPEFIIKQHIPIDLESAEKLRDLGAKQVMLTSESFVMDVNNTIATISFSDIGGQDAIIFEGTGFRGFHIIEIIVSDEHQEFILETKTSKEGNLFMPWFIPELMSSGEYSIVFSDWKSSHEIFIDIP